jgi:hypothetical protein
MVIGKQRKRREGAEVPISPSRDNPSDNPNDLMFFH